MMGKVQGIIPVQNRFPNLNQWGPACQFQLRSNKDLIGNAVSFWMRI